VPPIDSTSLDPQVAAYVKPFHQAALDAPRRYETQVELGLVCAANELWEEAAVAFDAALTLRPGDRQSRLYKALALRETGDYPAARIELDAIVRADPNFPAALHRLGNAYLEEGEFASAEAVFQRLVNLAPKVSVGYVGVGSARLSTQRYAEAAASLEQAVALDPADRHARHLLGLAYRGLGRREEARLELVAGHDAAARVVSDAWTERMEQHARSLYSQIDRASALLAQNRATDALDIMVEAHRWHPDSTAVLNNLANCYLAAGDPAKAMTHLERAIELDPGDFAARINAAAVRLAQRDPAAALEQISHAVAIAPDVAQARLVHGRALAALNRADEALEAFATAAELDPHNDQAHSELYQAYFARGDLDQCVVHARVVAERHPSHLPIQLQLCRLQLQLGHRDEARLALDRARRINPEHPDVIALTARFDPTWRR
jgi:tetratricopeptide (TPR) repeat protein